MLVVVWLPDGSKIEEAKMRVASLLMSNDCRLGSVGRLDVTP